MLRAHKMSGAITEPKPEYTHRDKPIKTIFSRKSRSQGRYF
jgi:hypothetical protein